MQAFLGRVLLFSTTFLAIYALPQSQNVTCTVDGRDYGLGDAIGDQCNGCVCTQFGAMCQLRMCPPVRCEDKVRPSGECCDTCPTGPNCAYTGSRGTSLVPADGCRYSETMVCFCYEDRRTHKMMPYCVPALPGETLPECAITSPNTL